MVGRRLSVAVGYLGWPDGSALGDARRRGWLLDRLRVRLGRTGPRGAILCASDLLALGAQRAVRSRDLEPGLDIGIVGFDDSDVAEALQLTSLLSPTLTVRTSSIPS